MHGSNGFDRTTDTTSERGIGCIDRVCSYREAARLRPYGLRPLTRVSRNRIYHLFYRSLAAPRAHSLAIGKTCATRSLCSLALRCPTAGTGIGRSVGRSVGRCTQRRDPMHVSCTMSIIGQGIYYVPLCMLPFVVGFRQLIGAVLKFCYGLGKMHLMLTAKRNERMFFARSIDGLNIRTT